jgi:(2Fe-2S) ferredoxin
MKQLTLSEMPESEASAPLRVVRVCQGSSCRKLGGKKVLATFRANPVANALIESSGCLKQCGNGPMILVLPDFTWYEKVHPDEVPTVIEKHLRHDEPVKAMLYEKYHMQ